MLLGPAVRVLPTVKSMSRGVVWQGVALLWAYGKQGAADSLRCNILVWIRCCVFTEGKANPCGVMCKRHTLWFGDLNDFKGVSLLNCHPNATFGLGVQHGSCWSQQHCLNIRSVMCNLKKIKLSDSQWDSSFLFIPWPNTVLSFGLDSTSDASISSAGLAMSMNRDL